MAALRLTRAVVLLPCFGVEETWARRITASNKLGLEVSANISMEETIDMPELGSVLTMYNTVNNLVGIVGQLAEMNTIIRSKLVGNVMYDLETLYAIHDMIVKKLNMTHKSWSCETCNPVELERNFKFNRVCFTGLNFEKDMQTTGCVHTLKQVMRDMRVALEQMELKAWQMVEDLASTTIPKSDVSQFLELDIGCDGEHLDSSKLVDFHETSEHAHCRELPNLSASAAQAECVQKCLDELECAGFAWLDGEKHAGIAGSRCCFRSAVTWRYEQEATACFIASRARLLTLDAGGVVDWMESRGFGAYKKTLKRQAFNGLVLAALSKSKIKHYLGVRNDKAAASLKCIVDTEIVGVPSSQCNKRSVIDSYNSVQTVVDPFVYFGAKSRNGNYLSSGWALGAVSRLSSWARKLFLPKASKFATAASLVEQVIGTYLGWKLTYGSANDLADQMFITSAFNPLTFAAAASHLAKTALQSTWDSCNAVYLMLMDKNMWEEAENEVQGR